MNQPLFCYNVVEKKIHSHRYIRPVRLQVLISQRVQPGHVDAEIGGLEQILDLLGVRVEPGRVDVDVGREDAVNHRAKGRRGNTGVSGNGIVTKTVDHLKLKALNDVYILVFCISLD